MTLVVSTSSPQVSVALFDSSGVLLAEAQETPAITASGAVIAIAHRLLGPKGVIQVERFVADIGPGSFSGVKVGVTMVKCWAFATGSLVAGLSSFDLVDAGATVAISWGRDRALLRTPGEPPALVESWPPNLAGSANDPLQMPLARNAGGLLSQLVWLPPAKLVPAYVVEPSISSPKQPYASKP